MQSLWVSPSEIRAEAFALGDRHHGEVVAGALLEAAVPHLPFRRAILLKAVIRGERLAAKARDPNPR
jgi:hypothetical protein